MCVYVCGMKSLLKSIDRSTINRLLFLWTLKIDTLTLRLAGWLYWFVWIKQMLFHIGKKQIQRCEKYISSSLFLSHSLSLLIVIKFLICSLVQVRIEKLYSFAYVWCVIIIREKNQAVCVCCVLNPNRSQTPFVLIKAKDLPFLSTFLHWLVWRERVRTPKKKWSNHSVLLVVCLLASCVKAIKKTEKKRVKQHTIYITLFFLISLTLDMKKKNK